MKCDTCGHEDYAISNNTGGNTATITFNMTITTGGPMPIYRFHLDCECCKNGHKNFRITEAR